MGRIYALRDNLDIGRKYRTNEELIEAPGREASNTAFAK